MSRAPGDLVELARPAQRDLRRLSAVDRRRVQPALEALAAETENLDIKAITGKNPWLRLRAGNFRILHREITAAELDARMGRVAQSNRIRGYLIARVIHRSELERALDSL